MDLKSKSQVFIGLGIMHLLPGELYPVSISCFCSTERHALLLITCPLPKFICSTSLGTKDVLLQIGNLVVIFYI